MEPQAPWRGRAPQAEAAAGAAAARSRRWTAASRRRSSAGKGAFCGFCGFPGGSGFRVLRVLRAKRARLGVRVVFEAVACAREAQRAGTQNRSGCPHGLRGQSEREDTRRYAEIREDTHRTDGLLLDIRHGRLRTWRHSGGTQAACRRSRACSCTRSNRLMRSAVRAGAGSREGAAGPRLGAGRHRRLALWALSRRGGGALLAAQRAHCERLYRAQALLQLRLALQRRQPRIPEGRV